jgi:ferredoxin, 2Fe-2S
MVKVLFKDHAGREQSVEAATGGGSCSCATCHVYVDEAWVDKLAAIDPNEDAMLGLSSDRRENSRLCCQITLSAELDGLSVTTPEFQF